MPKKVIAYSVGGVIVLIAGVYSYAKIVEWKERKGKKVIEEGSFTIIVDEQNLISNLQSPQLSQPVNEKDLSSAGGFDVDTDFSFEPFSFNF